MLDRRRVYKKESRRPEDGRGDWDDILIFFLSDLYRFIKHCINLQSYKLFATYSCFLSQLSTFLSLISMFYLCVRPLICGHINFYDNFVPTFNTFKRLPSAHSQKIRCSFLNKTAQRSFEPLSYILLKGQGFRSIL